jgi:hypothetical protein
MVLTCEDTCPADTHVATPRRDRKECEALTLDEEDLESKDNTEFCRKVFDVNAVWSYDDNACACGAGYEWATFDLIEKRLKALKNGDD